MENNINNNLINFCNSSYFELSLDAIDSVSSLIISQCIRSHLQNSRQGTVACKDRGDLISRSNKKPWKQKGTGKARAGTARSPLWRGGGVIHGPQKRIGHLKVSKDLVRKSNLTLFRDLIKNNKIISIDWLPDGKCSSIFKILKKNDLDKKKLILLYDINDIITCNSFSNLKNINMISYDSVHPYIMAHGYNIIFLEKDNEKFKSLVSSWQK